MPLSEIEKLERRYAENPQGLTFAPLAEVHRKAGDAPRALELLRPGLEIHPDYIPGSIVLGRCHVDLADLPSAEAAFTHVLELDGENVIALKALADITERLQRFDETERWLQQLLSVDRSNDDARSQLQRIETAREQLEPLVSAPVEETWAESPSDSVAEESPDVAPLVLEQYEYESTPQAEDRPPAGLEIEEPVRLDELGELVEPVEGLTGRERETVPADADDFQIETSEDIILRSSGGSEFQMPDAAQELSAPPAEPISFPQDLPAPKPAAASLPEPETVVTETMAEVLLTQGHTSEALRVYRELESRSSGDSRLRQKITELEAADAEPAPARRSYLARDTGGQSVRAFFQDLLATRPAPSPADAGPGAQASSPPPVPSAPETGGAPTRPAADALSLSSVFGEEPAPMHPAVPAAGAAEGSGVSFDEFFTPPGSNNSPRTSRTPDGKNDDLDQFHAWLQNLKR
ncbi:MAG: tetratricopeptide repeat protein [Gemmatimonadales bacterium]